MNTENIEIVRAYGRACVSGVCLTALTVFIIRCMNTHNLLSSLKFVAIINF